MIKEKWTDEDTKAVLQYKADLKSGKAKPVKYTGNLRELCDVQSAKESLEQVKENDT